MWVTTQSAGSSRLLIGRGLVAEAERSAKEPISHRIVGATNAGRPPQLKFETRDTLHPFGVLVIGELLPLARLLDVRKRDSVGGRIE